MQKLSLSDWANVAEIIASFVIVGSLVYVGFEINQNTQALQHASYQNTLDRMGEEQRDLANNPDLLAIVMKAETSPEEMTPIEWRRFVHHTLPALGTWEYMYLARQDGAVAEMQWQAFDPYFRVQICSAGRQRLAFEAQYAFSQDFASYVLDTVISNCDKSPK